MTRARAWGAVAAMALVAVAGWALIPTYPDYDAYHHLVWGRDLLRGRSPGFETFAAPTQHPLYLALGTVLALAGEHADRLLVLVTILSLVALTAAAFALGRALFGAWAGAAAALFVGSSFAFLLYAVRAFVDVPFLALVVWAAALEAARPRRGLSPDPPNLAASRRREPSSARIGLTPRGSPTDVRPIHADSTPDAEPSTTFGGSGLAPMALLALAGLLRPEAWVLAALYWLWCRGRGTRAPTALLALALSAPVVWALVDLVVTGDPLFSLHATSSLAEALGRERGLSTVPSSFVTFIADVARPPIALAGVVGLVLAVRRFGWSRMAVPVALVGAGALTFVGTGIAGLSILPRYLTLPAVALCVLAGYAVMGWTTIDPGPVRERWRRAAIGALAIGVAFLAVKASSFVRLRDELRFIHRTHEQLSALLAQPRVRAGLRCGALTFPTYRLVPDARWILDAGPERVRSRAQDPRAGAVAVYIAGDEKFERRFGRADGVERATNALPRGEPSVRQSPFAVFVNCSPRRGWPSAITTGPDAPRTSFTQTGHLSHAELHHRASSACHVSRSRRRGEGAGAAPCRAARWMHQDRPS